MLDLISRYTEIEPCGYNVWQAKCPHPDHNDSKPSFRIWKHEDGTYNWTCMGCHVGSKNINTKNKNYGSDIFAFIQWMSDYKNSKHIYSFYESIIYLANLYNIDIPVSNPAKEKLIKDKIEQNTLLSYCYNKNLSKHVKQYLYDRGLNDLDIQNWRIGSNLFRDNDFRITFPLFNKDSKVLGFSSRAYNWNKESNRPKYINSKESDWFHKRSYLYGQHLLNNEKDYIIITEGVFDVILANKYNIDNVVATLGTAFTADHVKLIKRLKKAPIFCLDSDFAGQKATYRAIDLLAKEGIYSKICILPEGMDLADLANLKKEETDRYILSHCLLYFQYLLKDDCTYFASKIDELRLQILPNIINARKSIKTEEEKILFNNFCIERFGINNVSM